MTNTDDTDLRALAARQYGVLAWDQARRMGYSRDALRHRIGRGEWERLTPRVLGRVGARHEPRRWLMEATLDGGPGTVVSRRAAAGLWRLPGSDRGRWPWCARPVGGCGPRTPGEGPQPPLPGTIR